MLGCVILEIVIAGCLFSFCASVKNNYSVRREDIFVTGDEDCFWDPEVADDSSIGNAGCDPWLNKKVYDFDGGDCCECTCVDGPEISCDILNNFNCLDPGSGCIDPKVIQYANCSGDLAFAGNAICESFNNNPSCGFDDGDCCRCDEASSGNYLCLDPQSACVDPVVTQYADCTGDLAYYGDGFCDAFNNFASCGFDGGDCCPCTCSAGESCIPDELNCGDPSAGRMIYDCKKSPPLAYPCPAVTREWVVKDSTNVQDLAESMCAGGTFEVEWIGQITVKRSILVVDGAVLRVTGTGLEATADGEGSHQIFAVSNASLYLENMILQNGSAAYGGAIAASASILTFNTTVFLGNRATRDGGVMLVTGGSNVSFDRQTLFSNNSAQVNGGALRIDGNSTASCTGVIKFMGNTAEYGGALSVSDSSVAGMLGSTTFSGNIAAWGGAAYISNGSSVSSTGLVSFHNNGASRSGGALFIVGASRVLMSGASAFMLNFAGSYGGAVYLYENSGISWKSESSFVNNTAGNGGALYSESSSITGLDNASTSFVGNTASGFGGAIVLARSTLSLTGETSFVFNTANYDAGGAISASQCSNIFLEGMTAFSKNSAGEDGGALSLDRASSASWTSTTYFLDNRAGLDGGALSVSRGSASFWRASTILVQNSATQEGGALHVSQRSTVSWNGASTFLNNSADYGGALFIMDGANVEWSGETDFIANTAVMDGGAVASKSFVSSNSSSFASTVGEESILVINGSTRFEENACGINGGGMAMRGMLSMVFEANTSATFTRNSAGLAGGAICLSDTGRGPILTGLSFVENSADIGGAIFASGSGNMEIGNARENNRQPTTFVRCTFVGNQARALGGAVYSAIGSDLFIDCSFAHNSAAVGGALQLAGVESIFNCSFVDNVSGEGSGPAVSNHGAIMAIEGVTFYRNVFSCDAGSFLGFSEANRSTLYATFCDGCDVQCEQCSFDEGLQPECVWLSDAGMQHASSSGGVTTISEVKIDAGYWRATSNSTKIVGCFNAKACQGGVTGSSNFCRSGYGGLYCSVCTNGHFPLHGYDCTGGFRVTAVIGTLMACVFVCATIKHLASAETDNVGRGIMQTTKDSVPLHSLKIVIISWQILSQFASVTQKTYPGTIQTCLGSTDFLINFDPSWILIMARLVKIDFHGRLLIVTLWPFVAIGLIFWTYMTKISAVALESRRRRYTSVALWLMVLVYSNTSSVTIQTFDCEDLDDGHAYLRADYSIACDTSKHRAFAVYATFMVIIYTVGIPSFFAYVLFVNRDALKNPGSRNAFRSQPTSNLWKPYKPSRYYYEIIECVRRICLTSAAQLVIDGTAKRVAVTLVFAFAFALLSERLNPYVSQLHRRLDRIGHIVVFMTIYFLSFADNGNEVDESSSRRAAWEVMLLGTHSSMAIIVLFEFGRNILKRLSLGMEIPSRRISSIAINFNSNRRVLAWLTGSTRPNWAVSPADWKDTPPDWRDTIFAESELPAESTWPPSMSTPSSRHSSSLARIREQALRGEEYEILAGVLDYGQTYESEQKDVRLTVPWNSLRHPGPGPIRLNFSSKILHGEDRDFFTDVVVLCPPRFQFNEPLKLDFLIDDPAINSFRGALSDVLIEYQQLIVSRNSISQRQKDPPAKRVFDKANSTRWVLVRSPVALRVDSQGTPKYLGYWGIALVTGNKILARARKAYAFVLKLQRERGYNTALYQSIISNDITFIGYITANSLFLIKVLRKEEDESWWKPIEERDMLLVNHRGATYLRSHIHHFTLFSCCRNTDVNNGYLYGNQKDKGKVRVNNATDARVLFIMLPLKFTSAGQRRHSVRFTLGAGNVEAGVGVERGYREEYITLPFSEAPSSTVLEPHARKQQLRVRENRGRERLLVCTLHDYEATLAPSSPSNPSQIASSASGGSSIDGGRDEQIVRLWDNVIVSGGDTLVLLPSRLKGGCQRSCTVNKQNVVLAHVAMVLAGLGHSTDEAKEDTTPVETVARTGWSLSRFSRRSW